MPGAIDLDMYEWVQQCRHRLSDLPGDQRFLRRQLLRYRRQLLQWKHVYAQRDNGLGVFEQCAVCEWADLLEWLLLWQRE